MSNSLEYLPRARKDLKRIGRWSRGHFGVERAGQTMGEIRDACERIREYPQIGRMRAELGETVRTFVVGSYVVVYRVDETTVSVLAVIHQRQDIREDLID
jgi:toxin ParE1/3/4